MNTAAGLQRERLIDLREVELRGYMLAHKRAHAAIGFLAPQIITFNLAPRVWERLAREMAVV